MGNFFVGLVLIALAVLLAGLFLFDQFGPTIASPRPALSEPDPIRNDPARVIVTVGRGIAPEELPPEAAPVKPAPDPIQKAIDDAEVTINERMKKDVDSQNRLHHKVQKGETLTSLAKKFLGDEKLLRRILEENPGLADPDHLQVNQEILIPLSARR